ncbi:MAG: amino acid adenylation domain-containing protein [Micromonosporaceae bacterium]|nr:amino acid adenylation domain-containing protein [Micromonosporaceae bacterium]
MFERQAASTPDATAVSVQGVRLTYADLNARANRLARHIRAAGVVTGSPVAIRAQRRAEMLVGLLAILKAGGCYVALDLADPPERQVAVLRDSDPTVLLTGPPLGPTLAAVRTVPLDHDPVDLAAADLGLPLGPEDVAYIAYTSGSTGAPKGAMIPHRAVLRLVRNPNYLAIGPGDATLQLAPLAFDASTLEVWAPLLNGARVAVFPPEDPTPERIAEVASAERVTVLWLTAGLFHQMAEGPVGRLRTVRQLLAGGDVLSPQHVNSTLAALPGIRLVNGYGPTENTTFTCCHVMTEPVSGATTPIGRPITGTEVHLLDESLRPVADGETGELYAGGDGVAHGYLGRPELTAGAFVPDPFAPGHGKRMYRTGDLARRRPDGVLEFLGRADSQVKIRGFRVEPGEVEAALLRLPDVRAAAVVAQEHPRSGNRLVAFVVADAALSPPALRQRLGESLPAYLVPSSFVRVPALPLNRNGKVDRAELRRRRVRQRPAVSAPYRPAEHPVEEALTALWAGLLGIDEVGVDDDFLELGGDSLIATQAATEIGSRYGVSLGPREIYQQCTVAAIAGLIADRLLAGIEEMTDEEALALLRQHQVNEGQPAGAGDTDRDG